MSILADMEDGRFSDWRIPLGGLAYTAVQAERHDTAVALCDWALDCEPLGVVGRHSTLLAGYEACFHRGRMEDSFRLACKDVHLTPALIAQDRDFLRNREDSLSYAEARALDLSAPERMVPLLAWAVKHSVLSETEGSEWVERMVEEMRNGRLADRAPAFTLAAVNAGLLSRDSASDALG